MTSGFSWQNSVSLWPALFYTPGPNLPVTPDVSWLPTFAFQSSVMKRTSFLGVSSGRSCRSSQNCSTSASYIASAFRKMFLICITIDSIHLFKKKATVSSLFVWYSPKIIILFSLHSTQRMLWNADVNAFDVSPFPILFPQPSFFWATVVWKQKV